MNKNQETTTEKQDELFLLDLYIMMIDEQDFADQKLSKEIIARIAKKLKMTPEDIKKRLNDIEVKLKVHQEVSP